MLQKINKLMIVLILVSTCLVAKAQKDSIQSKQVNEMTVCGLASGNLSLPYLTVGKEKLQKKNYSSTAEALKDETGIYISKDGVWASSVNIHGLSEQHLSFLVDDNQMQTAADVAGVLSTVNLNRLERIEVIKGAASVLYGNGAMGGAVNFVNYRPQYTETTQTNGNLNAGYTSVNSMLASSANVNITNKNWYIGLNGSYTAAGNMQTPIGEELNSQFNNGSWGLVGGMKYKDNQELLVNYDHYAAWDAGIPGGSAFTSASLVKYVNFKRDLLSGEYIFTNLTDNLDRLSFKAYTQEIVRDVENDVSSGVKLYPSSTNTTSGFKTTADFSFDGGDQLTTGFDVWQRKSESIQYRDNMSLSDSTMTVELPTPNATMLDGGVFGYYKHTLVPSKLNLHAGLRLDFIRTQSDTSFVEVDKFKISNGKSLRIPHNKSVLFYPQDLPELTYSAHVDLEYLPDYSQKLLLSIATSYRAASIEERFKYINLAGGAVHKGNPDLKPERGYFSDVSYSLGNKTVGVKADVFANYLFDLIAEELVSPVLFENKNIDKAFFVGAEAEFRCLINRSVDFLANASYVKGRNVSSDEFLPQIPPLHGFVTLNYHADRLLNTSLSAEWASNQDEVAPGESKTVGYIVFDWDIQSHPISLNRAISLKLNGGVNNLLNTEYYNHLTSVRAGGAKLPEPGRNIYARVTVLW